MRAFVASGGQGIMYSEGIWRQSVVTRDLVSNLIIAPEQTIQWLLSRG